MCPSGCTRFVPFRRPLHTCCAVVLPAPCEVRDTSIKRPVTALSQHPQLAERTNTTSLLTVPALVVGLLLTYVTESYYVRLILRSLSSDYFIMFLLTLPVVTREQTCETRCVVCKYRYFSGCFLAAYASVPLIKCY